MSEKALSAATLERAKKSEQLEAISLLGKLGELRVSASGTQQNTDSEPCTWVTTSALSQEIAVGYAEDLGSDKEFVTATALQEGGTDETFLSVAFWGVGTVDEFMNLLNSFGDKVPENLLEAITKPDYKKELEIFALLSMLDQPLKFDIEPNQEGLNRVCVTTTSKNGELLDAINSTAELDPIFEDFDVHAQTVKNPEGEDALKISFLNIRGLTSLREIIEQALDQGLQIDHLLQASRDLGDREIRKAKVLDNALKAGAMAVTSHSTRLS